MILNDKITKLNERSTLLNEKAMTFYKQKVYFITKGITGTLLQKVFPE